MPVDPKKIARPVGQLKLVDLKHNEGKFQLVYMVLFLTLFDPGFILLCRYPASLIGSLMRCRSWGKGFQGQNMFPMRGLNQVDSASLEVVQQLPNQKQYLT